MEMIWKYWFYQALGRFYKHFLYLHKNTKQAMLSYPFLSTNKIPNTHKQVSKKILPVFQTHSSSFPKITCNPEKRMVSYQSNLSVTELILLLHSNCFSCIFSYSSSYFISIYSLTLNLIFFILITAYTVYKEHTHYQSTSPVSP